MKLEKKTNVKFELRKLLKKNAPFSFSVLSFKRDREVKVQYNGKFTIVENGFANQRYANLTSTTVEKKLDEVLRVEFPRSHDVFIK